MARVAELAGVSSTTVSHVLNESRAVNEPTRRVVLAAIEATGYRRNSLARSLATSRTMTLGMASTPVSNAYFSELVRSVEATASAAGYALLITDTHDDPDRELAVVQQLVDRRVDGVLLAPSGGAARGAVPLLERAGMPTVLLDRFVDADLDQVAPENEDATAALTGHLADLGHARVAMVTGREGLHSTVERLAGHRRAVASRGLDDDPSLVVPGGSVVDAAQSAALELFSRADRPGAVVVGNNAMTIGVMKALRTLGLRIPDDVALVCFDDFEWADFVEPRLTTIAQDVAATGSKAVEMMVARLAEPDRPARQERVVPHLVHRTSCGCGADGSGPVGSGRVPVGSGRVDGSDK